MPGPIAQRIAAFLAAARERREDRQGGGLQPQTPPPATTQRQPAQSAPAASAGQSRGNPEVLALQQSLLARGFDPGPLDGIMGPRTRAAMAAASQAEMDAQVPLPPSNPTRPQSMPLPRPNPMRMPPEPPIPMLAPGAMAAMADPSQGMPNNPIPPGWGQGGAGGTGDLNTMALNNPGAYGFNVLSGGMGAIRGGPGAPVTPVERQPLGPVLDGEILPPDAPRLPDYMVDTDTARQRSALRNNRVLEQGMLWQQPYALGPGTTDQASSAMGQMPPGTIEAILAQIMQQLRPQMMLRGAPMLRGPGV